MTVRIGEDPALPEALPEDELDCAEGLLDYYAAMLDLEQTAFACVGDYIKAVVEAALARAHASNTPASRDVLAERQRQVSAEGWTPEHDDGHVNDEIAAMACFYAMPPGAREWSAEETGYGATWGEAIVPDDWVFAKVGDRRRELVKAGALILAEIERIDRAAKRKRENGDA